MDRRRRVDLEAMLAEAFIDAYGEEEQLTGLFTMVEEELALPFDTEVLGIPVQVVAVDMTDSLGLVAVCRRGDRSQRVALEDLPLPSPPPPGADWIAAYRLWREGVE
jgi:hypothetical protein